MAVTVTDTRSNTKEKSVWKAVAGQMSWADGVTAAVTDAFGVNGIVRQMTVAVSDNTGNRTATVSLIDGTSTPIIYTSAAQPENATTITRFMTESGTDFPMEIFINGATTISVAPSGDPGAGGMTVDIIFYGE
jgi:hypothetical protein